MVIELIVSDDKFKVGLDLLIRVEIKPRSVTGLILAVHGRGDYLVLQMVDGKVSKLLSLDMYVPGHNISNHIL